MSGGGPCGQAADNLGAPAKRNAMLSIEKTRIPKVGEVVCLRTRTYLVEGVEPGGGWEQGTTYHSPPRLSCNATLDGAGLVTSRA